LLARISLLSSQNQTVHGAIVDASFLFPADRLKSMSRLGLLAAIALTVLACSKAAPLATEDIRPVRTMTVGVVPVDTASAFAAEIRPRTESRLSFRVPGKMIERLVDAGASVKPGQVLARLDPRDLVLSESAAQAQLAQARANYELAASDLTRTQALAAQSFVSASNVDRAQTQLKAAKGQLDAAQASARVQGNQAGYSALLADRAGVVTATEAEPGQVVAAGQTVVRIAATNVKGSDTDVVFNVPEQIEGTLKPGQGVNVSLWSVPGKTLSATVREISPSADPATRTYAVKASLIDPENVAALGMTATATLGGAAAVQAIVVPLNAVIETAGSTAVWVVQDGAVKQTAVKVAGPAANGVVIASGLVPGQKIVTAGVHTIREGQKVKLAELAPAAPVAASAAKKPAATQP
jgi:membrane fusion protein, multidrug efflux system